MLGRRAGVRWAEPLLLLGLGCQQPAPAERQALGHAPTAHAPVPRAAAAFDCSAASCTQLHPRLPDTGEWRCAERQGVVWCAGGEPAAGVVAGPPDPHYKCGARWGQARPERVCVDAAPDYPPGREHTYACRFEQERGVRRVCRPTTEPRRALPPHALVACWLDRDCRSGRCDRGACACSSSSDCEHGTCRSGLCSEPEP